MNITQVLEEGALNILKGKIASADGGGGGLSDKTVQTLKEGLNLKNAIQLLASNKGDFAGYAAGHEDEIYKGLLSLKELFVDPKQQGKGIGTKLLAQVIEKAKEAGLEGLVAKAAPDNIPAQNLYEKLGLKKVDGKELMKEITYKLLFGENK